MCVRYCRVVFSGVAKVVLSYQHNNREPDFARAALWTVVHLYLGIVCANLTPCWPLFNRIARASTGSWVTLSSLGKRWYSLSSGGQSSKDRDAIPTISRGTRGDRSRMDDKTPFDVEAGRVDYEMAMYQNGHHGQISDDRVQLHGLNDGRAQW